MSSPLPEAPPERGRRRPWEPWRKVMLVGGLWLWAFYVYVAIAKVHPSQWVLFPVNFVGYGLLSVGFLLWMRARKGTPADRPETPKQEE